MSAKPFPPLVGVFLVGAIFVGLFAPGFVRLEALRSRERQLAGQVDSLRVKIEHLEEERERLRHDVDYLESIVRSELGHARPGEVIYKTQVFDPQTAPPPAVVSARPRPEPAKTVDTPSRKSV